VNSNAYGQATCALVLQPTANRLQAMVITEGGTALGDPSLATVASTIGGSGGGVYSTATATIKGAVGGWNVGVGTYENLPNNLGKRCDGSGGNVHLTPGHPMMALWFENGDVSSAFVARDAVPGHPELNAMNTPLVMNSVQTVDAACSTTGAIARDSLGGILSCKSGKWTTGADTFCKATGADVNTLEDSGCYNGAGLPNSPAGGDWVFIEVLRHFNLGAWYATQRATGMTGAAAGRVWVRTQQSGAPNVGWSGWQQYADPGVQVGNSNVTANGTVQGGYLYSTGDVYAANTVNGNYVYSRGDMYAAGNSNVGGSFYAANHVGSGGDIDAAGNSHAQIVEAFQSHRTYSSSDWGLLAVDASGGGNVSPGSAIGSAYLNDVYLRSVGKWGSQIARPTITWRTAAACDTCPSVATCVGNEVLIGGSCQNTDVCSGNDSTQSGGYPAGQLWVCPGLRCAVTQSYASCMN
jgi:hypothetical protein